MTDLATEERYRMIREVRQRLESLGRAGVDRVPAPDLRAIAVPAAPSPRVAVPRPEVARPAPATAPPATEPVRRPAPPPPAEPPRRPTGPSAPLAPSTPIVMPTASLFGDGEMADPVVAPADRAAQLATLASEVAVCERCPHLASTRTKTVFGSGSPTARLMFVGEAPGADEDRTGMPFVGKAGMLLTDMITKGMGLDRADVYIANILKSRPPGNRDPEPGEIAHCLPYLERQIAIVRPEFLCLLGRIASQTLLDTVLPMSRLRGKWHRYRGILTLVTYHPSYLLRNPAAKKDAWEDLQILMKQMGLTPPSRKKS